MHSVARLVLYGLRRKVGVKTVARRNGVDHGAEGDGVVGRTKGFGIAKVNFVLTGSLLVVGAFGLYAPEPSACEA